VDVLVLGANGQIGYRLLEQLGSMAKGLTRADIDLEDDLPKLSEKLDALHPKVVINAAAFTQVDAAEEYREQAQQLNTELPSYLARHCAERDLLLVHYSTDYVFSGQGTEPWKEEDEVAPLNFYGATKWEGEEAIRHNEGRYLILRTSWVYDSRGNNFLRKILQVAKERPELKIVNDQIGSPSWAKDLATHTIQMLSSGKVGTYHLVNSGYTSWFEFAKELLSQAKDLNLIERLPKLTPVNTSEWQSPAARPLNSRLSIEKWKADFSSSPRPWQDALKDCLLESAARAT